MNTIHQVSQLKNQAIRERQSLISAIDLLNDNGINVVEIDGTLYAYTSFDRPDDAFYDIEILGRNITTLFFNQVDTQGLSPQAITAFLQEVHIIPERRRRFHRDVVWQEFLAKGSS